MFWQAEQLIDESYVFFVQLLDRAGRLRAQAERLPVGGFRPTHIWQPDEVIRDNYGLALSPGLPSGRYQLIVGLYLPSSMEWLLVTTADGVQMSDYVALGEVTVILIALSVLAVWDIMTQELWQWGMPARGR